MKMSPFGALTNSSTWLAFLEEQKRLAAKLFAKSQRHSNRQKKAWKIHKERVAAGAIPLRKQSSTAVKRKPLNTTTRRKRDRIRKPGWSKQFRKETNQ